MAEKDNKIRVEIGNNIFGLPTEVIEISPSDLGSLLQKRRESGKRRTQSERKIDEKISMIFETGGELKFGKEERAQQKKNIENLSNKEQLRLLIKARDKREEEQERLSKPVAKAVEPTPEPQAVQVATAQVEPQAEQQEVEVATAQVETKPREDDLSSITNELLNVGLPPEGAAVPPTEAPEELFTKEGAKLIPPEESIRQIQDNLLDSPFEIRPDPEVPVPQELILTPFQREEQQMADAAAIMLDVVMFGGLSEIQAIQVASRENIGFIDALRKTRKELAASRKRAGQVDLPIGITQATAAELTGFLVSGVLPFAPEARALQIVERFAAKATQKTIQSLVGRVGEKQAALILQRLPAKFGSQVLGENFGVRTLQFMTEGGTSGMLFADAENLPQLMDGLKNGVALSAAFGAGLLAVRFAGRRIVGLEDRGGQAIARRARKEGFNLANPDVADAIQTNFIAATQKVEKKMNDFKSILQRQKDGVFAANRNVEIPIDQHFKRTRLELAELKSKAQKSGNTDLLKKVSELERSLTQSEQRLRLPSATEVTTVADPITLGRVKTQQPARTKNASFEALDGHKIDLQNQIWIDKQFKDAPRVERIAKGHQKRIRLALEKADVTKNLEGINDVYSSVIEAQAELPTVAQFGSAAKDGRSLASRQSVKKFGELLNRAKEENLNRYAPDMQVEIYGEFSDAWNDMVALRTFEKSDIGFMGFHLFNKKTPAQLIGKAGRVRDKIRKLPIVGLPTAATLDALAAAPRKTAFGAGRRAGGPQLQDFAFSGGPSISETRTQLQDLGQQP